MQYFYLDELLKEGSALQILTAFLFISCAVCAGSLRRISIALKVVLTFSFLFLACDELLMVHECAKIYLYNSPNLRFLGGEVMPLYLVSSAFILFLSRKSFCWDRRSLVSLSAALILAFVAIGIDVFNVRGVFPIVEEFCELGVGSALMLFLYRQPRQRINFFILSASCVAFVILIFPISFSKPLLCESIYKIRGVKYWGPFPYQ
ncbi:MAG: hypothetical protein HUU57_12365 [Bdellovibrio sp.]|nr:hypothetical protein [Bdellovibrio sp.]